MRLGLRSGIVRILFKSLSVDPDSRCTHVVNVWLSITMNGEFQDWLQEIEQAAQDFEKTVRESVETTLEQMAEAADAMIQVPIAIAEQLESTILTECDRVVETMDEWFSPPIQIYARFDMQWEGDSLDAWYDHLEPSTQEHPACIGCQHYHGYSYNGNALICGMHPYGWDGTECPDWEKK